ncbi:MAG: transposase [Acidobacteria bacterium]|nr:transposase [Acidobacteriota bacterium]
MTKRKKRLTGIGVQVGAMRPIAPNVIWAMDFQFDQTSDLRPIKMLNVIDEFTRECLTIDVARSITTDDVVNRLDELMKDRGAPHYVRMENGPEFVAHALHDWCRFNEAGSLFIDPGSPWQNGWIESFNARLRDEWRIQAVSATNSANLRTTNVRVHPYLVRSTELVDPRLADHVTPVLHLIGEEPVAELRVVVVQVDQLVHEIGVVEIALADRVLQPAVPGLSGDAENPAGQPHRQTPGGQITD